MRGWRTASFVLAACLVALGVHSGIGARPARAAGPQPVTLGHLNVISGDRIAGMRVRVPRAATIERTPFNNGNVSFEGDGRIVGVVLVEERDPIRKAYQLIATRWDFCGSPGCRGPWRMGVTHGANWRGRQGYRIPAGDYRLYLVADGVPVTVRLRLDGLTGSRDLRPRGEVAGKIVAPRTMLSPASQLFLGTARKVMPAPGLLMDGDLNDHGLGPNAGSNGVCHWRPGGEQDVRHDVPGPHCMTFAERGGIGAWESLLGGGNASVSSGPAPAGRWRSSYWRADAAVESRNEFMTLWLPYERP